MGPFPPQLYLVINFALGILALCIVAIFARYIVIEALEFGYARMRMRAAVGILVVMVGQFISRFWVWFGLYRQHGGAGTHWMMEDPWGYVPLGGAIITGIGLLCLIRVFSPDAWGSLSWSICAALALGATLLMLISVG